MPGTNYPTALDTTTTLRTVTDATDDVLAIDQNYPRDAVIALETKTGYGADTPTVGKFLVGNTTAGTSQWRVLATTDIPDVSATYVPKSLYDANTILYATTNDTPVALTVGASTIVGRKATGDIVALSATEARTILNVADGATANAKNSSAEVNTGTDDAKFMTAASFKGSIYNNYPQGSLLNGKIVPSVTSNNLTVAIKGLDGNDPSASNPVYCRIGDTVRSITAALSVTKNAGTNWCNSGSAELATKEIDYFVYLGYNATDGVVIGFSRIPYVKRYDGFSTTSTNERYCAISTITTAAAGDYYENIGRFAATLSAGAGYTWTVPTFTADNLIQRPIYNTRILVYTPTIAFTGTGAPTTPNANFTLNHYQIYDKTCRINVFRLYGVAGNAITLTTFTLPITENVSLASSAIYPVAGRAAGATLTDAIVFVSTVSVTTTAGAITQVGAGGNYSI